MHLPNKSLLRHLSLFSVLGRANHPQFVPKYLPAGKRDVDKLKVFIDNSKRLLVITGAGISTESGIPDYRSADVGLYASSEKVEKYEDFKNKPNKRKKYWANSFVSWTKFASLSPNKTHNILSEWEKKDKLHWLVTQNVDGLHSIAESHNHTELHGSLYRIGCVECNHMITRSQLQDIMERLNPMWISELVNIELDKYSGRINESQAELFEVPLCNQCGGMLKPDIVFFDNTVPASRTNFVFKKVEESDSLLVLGSSLEVHSGFRFVKRTHEQGKPIAIVNIGPTRADILAKIKINTKCSEILDCIHDM